MATGFAGDPNARTPWLDGLATAAVNYAEAVTPHPLGPQARAALLTGQLGPANGVADYWDALPVWRRRTGGAVGEAEPGRTVAHALGERGYATAFFGKWHLAERDRAAPLVGEEHARMVVPPERRGGFALWEGFESGFLLNDPWLHGTRLAVPTRFRGYQADVLAERAGRWLGGEAARHAAVGEPFFCVVSLEAPHPPYHAPAPHVAARRAADIVLRPNVPTGGEVEARARGELAGYYAHLEATDRAVGRLLSAVDLAETAVVFTSVHGDMHGSHGLFRKGWPHEESVRVPLLVHLPGGGPRVDRAPVSLVDLPHLAVAWADGREWRCRRDAALISMPAPTMLAGLCPAAWRGFRSAQHKLVVRTEAEGGERPWLYFDLARDPWEGRNLVGVPEHAAEITERLRWL